jgi:hypothetical protein
MSNYYKSKCCDQQVSFIRTSSGENSGYFVCPFCGKECEIIAMIDTPNDVPKEEKIKGTKDSVCNECYDNGFKGSPCPHIDVQQYQEDIEAGKEDCKVCGRKGGHIIPFKVHSRNKEEIEKADLKQYQEDIKAGVEVGETESVYHFVTVIGILLEDPTTKERYAEAIQYTLDFIKYRFDKNNIK